MQQAISIQSIMHDFTVSTGLSGDSCTPRRYLWTDSFAVCNYLELYRQTGQKNYLQLALKLVDQVHQTLGRYRDDDVRSGWLSGLDGEAAQQHPTRGGLRIGKQLNEQQPGEPVDVFLEWGRDGQYFHYLTKWMRALNRVSQVTDKSIYNQWALELAKVAHSSFTCMPSLNGTKCIAWKMSVDLSRPLMGSMGQHDPLDGLITYQQLEATATRFLETPSELSLKIEIEEMAAMCSGQDWYTKDALGIGGLLTDAYKLVQLIDAHVLHETDRLEALLRDIERSLQAFVMRNQLDQSAEFRLAFRELGLATGLHAINRMLKRIERQPEHFINAKQLLTLLTNLTSFHRIYENIMKFWLASDHKWIKTWQEHADINSVMLATSLAPDGYLQL